MPYLKYCSLVFMILCFSPFHAFAMAGEDASAQKQQLKIFVSILPTEYFVQRIGGSRVQVETLVQPGHSPETYSPTPRQMTNLASSRIFFGIGLPFEKAMLPKLSRILPDLHIVDMQQGIDLQRLEDHADHDGHGHKEGDIDPHTWLDPMLAMKHAGIIRDTLAEADPAGKEEYDANYRTLADELQELHEFLRKTLAPFAGETIYVFHPAYGYFCRAYDLKQKAVTPGGKEPGAQYIARLIEEAKNDRVRVIFVQPQFSQKAAKTIARAINGSVTALDPLAYDYIENLKFMARQISDSLTEPVQ
ncbi:MAG: zinc ABC transporter substrate-binding protein [Desulfobulbaceae bacterium]|nr:zinc ABC transporter substrate-binding protein [Desulfobulbaceae bacterium]